LSSNGHDVEYLSGHDAVAAVEPALTGGDLLAALHSRCSGHVNAAAATKSLADSAAALGAAVVVGSTAVSIEKLDAPARSAGNHQYKYRVRTQEGAVHDCKALIIAAGAWARPLGRTLGVDIPVTPVKGQIWSTAEAPPGTLRKVIFAYEKAETLSRIPSRMRDDTHGIPSDVTHDHTGTRRVRHCYGRQRVDGCVIFGGDRVTTTADDYTVDKTALQHNAEHVYEFAPRLRPLGLHGEWAGLMPFSKDGRPMVGELAALGFEQLWVAVGFGSNGVMSGPHAGKLVGEAAVCTLTAGHNQAGSGLSKRILPHRLAEAVEPCRADGVRRT
jgi:glycine/D-amino acid oxidase-like deaminating enzyme